MGRFCCHQNTGYLLVSILSLNRFPLILQFLDDGCLSVAARKLLELRHIDVIEETAFISSISKAFKERYSSEISGYFFVHECHRFLQHVCNFL